MGEKNAYFAEKKMLEKRETDREREEKVEREEKCEKIVQGAERERDRNEIETAISIDR